MFASTSDIARYRREASSSLGHGFRVPSAFLLPYGLGKLRSILFGIKRNKAPGIYGIPVSDLCPNFDAIEEILIFMINGFPCSGHIFVDFKIARVKPLLKGDSPKNHDSYRPISILSCIEAIWEKLYFLWYQVLLITLIYCQATSIVLWLEKVRSYSLKTLRISFKCIWKQPIFVCTF